MPQEDILQKDHRPAILQELDDFNTADTSDGIMLGILREQESIMDRQQRAEQGEDTRATERPEREDRDEPETEKTKKEKSEKYERYYAPLNSSIQELRSSQENRLDSLQRELSDMRQQQQVSSRQSQEPSVDPNEPVYHGHLQPFQQRQSQLENYVAQQAWRSEYQRARIEYLDFRLANPDFNLPWQEVDRAFRSYVGNDVNKAGQINWTGHFGQLHSQNTRPLMQAEVEKLRKENEDLKKKLEKPAPAARSTNAPEAHTVSPALRPAGRTVQSVVGERSNDVINLPSFKKGKSFKSYGRDLARTGLIR